MIITAITAPEVPTWTKCPAPLGRRLSLPKDGVWSQASKKAVVLRGAAGLGWATCEGDPRDYALRPGKALSFPAGRRVAVTAISELQFEVA